MAFTGRRQAALDEIDEDKEANLDPWALWAKSQLPGEEAATKALDELRLTPNLDGFLCPALVNALDPNDSKNYDAELRRAWLRLDEQARREIRNVCGFHVRKGASLTQMRSLILSRARLAIAEDAEDVSDAPLDDDLLRETDAASELPSENIVYTGTVTGIGNKRRGRGARRRARGYVHVDHAAAADDTP